MSHDIRLLIVTTYRSSDMALARHPFLSVKSHLQMRGVYEEVSLGFLAPDDVARYLDQQFPGHDFPTAFAESVHARTEGSPLFMADLLRYLRDRQVLMQEHGHWTLLTSIPDLRRELPERTKIKDVTFDPD